MTHKLKSREKYQQPQTWKWHYSNGRKWRGTKDPFDEGERGEWKSWLKTQHSKQKIIASSPITSVQIIVETMQTMRHLIFLGSKITADDDCSHERCLLLRRKAMTNLHSILKIREITLSTKVHIVKAMVFPVVIYSFESWTIKKAEHLQNWCFQIVMLEKIRESFRQQGNQTNQS